MVYPADEWERKATEGKVVGEIEVAEVQAKALDQYITASRGRSCFETRYSITD